MSHSATSSARFHWWPSQKSGRCRESGGGWIWVGGYRSPPSVYDRPEPRHDPEGEPEGEEVDPTSTIAESLDKEQDEGDAPENALDFRAHKAPTQRRRMNRTTSRMAIHSTRSAVTIVLSWGVGLRCTADHGQRR